MKSIKLIASAALLIGSYATHASTKKDAAPNITYFGEKMLPSTPSVNKTSSINKTAADYKLAHVVKLNVSQLALKNVALQYELGFHKNMSGALGFSIFTKRGLPKQLFENDQADGYKLPTMKGWAVTPEFRFYPGAKEEHQAPHGFYLAPYMRYAKYSLEASYTETTYIAGTTTVRRTTEYDFKGTYKGSTFGLMLGSQWISKGGFTFDWWIIGGGAGSAKLVLEGSTDYRLVNLSPQEQQELEDGMRTDIGELGRYSNGVVEIETTSNSAKATIKGLPMMSLRGMVICGLNFGYKF